MTATHVEGVAVIEDRPALSPLKDRAGNPVYWQQTRVLTLADGRTLFGCVHCDYTADGAAKIRPHLKKHKPAVPKGGDLSVSELIAKASGHDQVAAERDRWKSRALKAEKSLRALRDALGVSA